MIKDLKKKVLMITGIAIAVIIILCVSVVTAISCRDGDDTQYQSPSHGDVMVLLGDGEEMTSGAQQGKSEENDLQNDTESGAPVSVAPEEQPELRAVWVPYMSLGSVDAAKIDTIIANCKSAGANAIMLHVRPFGDALYKSSYFPWSHLVTGTQGAAPSGGFDPLAYAVQKAHENGMQLHAWINPLRIQAVGGSTPPSLSADNPYTKFRTDGNGSNDRWVIDYDGGKFFNPGEEGARKYIIDGIAEIVSNYDVDGIHWDDYFYPAYDSTFDDSASYSSYVNAGGLMSLSEWRTSNINKLVADTYSRVKSIKSDCVFGISPAGNISNCLRMGANVYTWCSEPGFVDYICPQIYWTFDGNPLSFASCCSQWKAMVTAEGVDFYVGLALYKAGSDADGGKWLSGNDIIARQIEHIRANGIDADGFMLYSYAYLKNEQTAKEMENVQKLLD